MKSWVPREFKQTYYSTKSPLNRRFFDRQTTHLPDPLVLAINYTSRLTATGTGQLSGATRAIIINQVCPTSAGTRWQNCADFCTPSSLLPPFRPSPRTRKNGRRVCRLCNLYRTTFSSTDACRRLNFPGKSLLAIWLYAFSLPLFRARTLYSAIERKREY